MSYFALRKQLGDESVGKTELLLGNENQIGSLHFLRNLYINMREQRLFADYFSIYLPYRGYVELAYTEDELQKFSPEVTTEVMKWSNGRSTDGKLVWDGGIEAVKNDPEIKIWIENKATLFGPDQLDNRKFAEEYFANRYKDYSEAIDAPSTDLFGTIDLLYRLQTLAEVEEYLLGYSSFNLDDAVSDPRYADELRKLMEAIPLQRD
jgi:hypothetical protein